MNLKLQTNTMSNLYLQNRPCENIKVQSISPIIDEQESRLAVDQVVKNVEDAYFMYCEHAHAKELGEKKEGEWRVTRFVMEHNYEIVEADQTYLLRSSRNLLNAQKSTLEAMANAKISATSAVFHMEEEAHGLENIRFNRRDAYDYLKSLKKSKGKNLVLKKASNRIISLYDFVLNYEKFQKTCCANEKIEDTRYRHREPPVIMKSHPLLIHVADMYTLNLYKLFEIELVELLSIEFVEDPSFVGSFFILFKMKSVNQYSKIRNVWLDKQKNEAKCSCHKFQSMGILCKHALKFIKHIKVHSIPKQYIKKQRTKSEVEVEVKMKPVVLLKWYLFNHSIRSFYNIIVQCKHHEEARNMLTKILHDAQEKTTALLENLSLNDLHSCDNLVVDEKNCQLNEMLIHDSLFVKSRGITNARIPRHWDEQSKKRKEKQRSKS
ncbi:hypothetical protein CDL12_11492 [Handroanthus impetiginosus]|uniref:SWIM-type domain-containing protein n=1 Tax=Handroanthus impetiginosus TaxID=429701 RepID=A0A2G9HEB4_9LAMI|nr:hypothetical protein CDL12_11492 [Handroanthus impetiginosus]